MPTDDEIPTVAIGDYVAVVVRRWRVVVAGAILGGLLAYGYLAVTPIAVSATSVINIAPITADPYNANRSSSSLVDMLTESQAAQSMTVAASAAESLGSGFDGGEIRKRLTVTTIASTTVMRITVTAPSAQQARAEADSVAAAYLQYRSAKATDQITKVLAQDDTQLQAFRAKLSDANVRLATAKAGSSAAADAEADKLLLSAQITAVLQRSSSVEGVDTSGGAILTPAENNSVSIAPQRLTALSGGVLVGIVLGLLGTFVRQARDRRIHRGVDVVAAGVGPVLARLSSDDLRSGRDTSELAVARERLLSTPEFASGRGILAFVEDVSTEPGFDVVAELARSFANSGIEVRLVYVPTMEADTPALARRLDLDLADANGVRASLTHPQLTVWTTADRPAWTGLTRTYVDVARDTALVILACPGTATDADRMATCRMADALVVHAVEQVSQRSALRDLSRTATAVHTPILGAVTISHRNLGKDQSPADVQPRHAAPPRPASATTTSQAEPEEDAGPSGEPRDRRLLARGAAAAPPVSSSSEVTVFEGIATEDDSHSGGEARLPDHDVEELTKEASGSTTQTSIA